MLFYNDKFVVCFGAIEEASRGDLYYQEDIGFHVFLDWFEVDLLKYFFS